MKKFFIAFFVISIVAAHFVYGQHERYTNISETAVFADLPAGLGSDQALLLMTGAVSEIASTTEAYTLPERWLPRQFSWLFVCKQTTIRRHVFISGSGIVSSTEVHPVSLDMTQTAARCVTVLGFALMVSCILALGNLARKEVLLAGIVALVFAGATITGVSIPLFQLEGNLPLPPGSYCTYIAVLCYLLTSMGIVWQYRVFNNL